MGEAKIPNFAQSLAY